MAFGLSACGNEPTKKKSEDKKSNSKPQISDTTIENNSLTNDFLGMTMTFPQGWVFASTEEMAKSLQLDPALLADKNAAKNFEKGELPAYPIAFSSKVPISDPDPNNSKIEIMIEKPEEAMSSIKYLQICKNMLIQSLPTAEFSDVLPTEIGGKPGHMLNVNASAGSVKVNQTYYVLAEGDYILTFATSYVAEDKPLIDQAMASITFEK